MHYPIIIATFDKNFNVYNRNVLFINIFLILCIPSCQIHTVSFKWSGTDGISEKLLSISLNISAAEVKASEMEQLKIDIENIVTA